ncbi:MAG TPA: c-type cytochrome [Burkholderiaceae bacterium]|nr:c-type cytochrome [Burkholderiaceae bacterium]
MNDALLRRARGAAAAALLPLAGAALAQPSAARLAVCAGCHGARGVSAIVGTPSLAGQPKLFIENQLVIIREGLREVPVMKPFVAGMADDEIGALATYYAAQPPKALAPAPKPDKARAGADIARRLGCGTCHLPTYAGQQQVPRLAGQDEAYLVHSMKQFRDQPGPGRDTIMAATLRGLSDGDLEQLAHHLAHAAP